ncbi:MAG: MFS transporter [Alphaproteobacteria bacterium]|nr:MFS transporter [Alphaproteobacteria bacterium]
MSVQQDTKRLAVTLLILANVLSAMSMDIHLPMAPLIMADLQTSEFLIQSIFIISVILTTTTPLFWGPLSDCYGRRALFLPACCFMIVGQFGCAVAPTIEWLLFARFVQYLGVGAVFTVVMAVICDSYTGIVRARMIALLEISIPFALIVAPIVGAFTASYFGWRYNFLLLGILQLILFVVLINHMPETLKIKRVFEWKRSFQNLSDLLYNRIYIRYVLIFAMLNAVYMLLIMHSPFILIKGLGASPTTFAFSQSCMIAVYCLGLFVYRRLVPKYGVTKLLNISMIGYCFYGLSTLFLWLGIIPFTFTNNIAIMFVDCFFAGPIITSCNSLALDACDDTLGGTNASMIESIAGAITGLFMVLSAYAANDSYMPVFVIIVGIVFIAFCVWFNLITEPKKEHLVN